MTGHGEDIAVSTRVRAGHLDAELEGIALRAIRCGPVELLASVYPAVRDEGWETLAAEVSDPDQQIGDDSFRISFTARHKDAGIDFTWHGEIDGRATGTISYSLSGRANAAFRYGRIGLNVLHPATRAGSRFRGASPDGEVSGRLPRLIAPQPFENGAFRGLFDPVTTFTVEAGAGLSVRTDFEGDLFEMEDQRNWTDASFKMYSTPAHLGVCHEARAGQSFEQRVTISCERAAPAFRVPPPDRACEVVELAVGKATGLSIPEIGLVATTRETGYSRLERERLRALGPDHLRSDISLLDPDWEMRLARAAEQARDLRCPLELGVQLVVGDRRPIERLVSLLRAVPVVRVHAFDCLATAAPPAIARATQAMARRSGAGASVLRAAMEHAGRELPIGGGTEASFVELNRARPNEGALDHIVYAISPQAHASDERSIMETLPIQRQTLECARTFSGGRPLIVGPVQLRMAFNPNASDSQDGRAQGLPRSVDARQVSLFAAAWTLGSIRELVLGGAHALTYYETVGWRGVLESDRGSPMPLLFPSSPATVFPVYHVLADVHDLKGMELLTSTSTEPGSVCSLAARCDGRRVVLVANLTSRDRLVKIPVGAGASARARILDDGSRQRAQFDPAGFRRQRDHPPVSEGVVTLRLSPYAVGRVDL